MSEVLTSMILSEQQSLALLSMLSKYVPENPTSGATLVIEDIDTFGRIFKRERQLRGITSTYVAEQMGYTCSWVTRMEKGHVSVSLSTMKRLAKLLGYSFVCIAC